jgi:hypothetical protein
VIQPDGHTAPRPGTWRPRRRPAARPRWAAAGPGPAQDDGGAVLPDWDALAGGPRQAAWDDLVSWVTWLHDRYELSVEERLPHCWAEHPGLVEELAALKTWHDEIRGSARPSGQAARYWHAELRQTITAALTWYAAGCRAGHHGAQPAAAQLRERWSVAAPPGNPAVPGAAAAGGSWLPAAAMTSNVSAGRARPLSQTVAGYLRHDRSWWGPAPGGWQRVADRATASLLDRHAEILARADQAVRQAAARQESR